MSNLNRSETNCQPCDNFVAGEAWEYNAHQCMQCGGVVYWCGNCYGDHHEGGYQTCASDKRAKCTHPACVAAEQAEVKQ